jgi:uncharacterized linocin/CFP29 family protein
MVGRQDGNRGALLLGPVPKRDPSAVIEAARLVALAEDHLVFQGFKAGGITGITEASPHPRLEIGDDYGQYPKTVAQSQWCGRLPWTGRWC